MFCRVFICGVVRIYGMIVLSVSLIDSLKTCYKSHLIVKKAILYTFIVAARI